MAKTLRFKDAEKARDEITSEQLERISKLYNDWADDIAKRAEKLKQKGTLSSELQSRQMEELEKALRKTSEKVANEVTKTVKEGMTKVCQSVVSQNTDWMESLGFPKDIISAAFSSVPDNIVRNIIYGKIYDTGWSLSQSIWGDNEDTLAKIHEIVAGGMAENKPIYDIAKSLEQYVRPGAKKQWNLRTKSGKMIYPKRVDYNAQRLARTLSQHAYQQSVKATSKENPFIQKIRWNSVGNRVCEICKKRNGKIYTIDKLPMDHPNGFCIMEQVVDDDIDDRLVAWVHGKKDKDLDAFAKKLGFGVDDMNIESAESEGNNTNQEGSEVVFDIRKFVDVFGDKFDSPAKFRSKLSESEYAEWFSLAKSEKKNLGYSGNTMSLMTDYAQGKIKSSNLDAFFAKHFGSNGKHKGKIEEVITHVATPEVAYIDNSGSEKVVDKVGSNAKFKRENNGKHTQPELAKEDKEFIKRYTDGYYDIPNEMAAKIREFGDEAFSKFVNSRVSETYSFESASERYKPIFESVKGIVNKISESSKFNTLVRISYREPIDLKVGGRINWGLRSTSSDLNIAGKALSGDVKGFEALDGTSSDVIVFEIKDAPGLDISKQSVYKSQKEVLVSGEFEIESISEPYYVDNHKTRTVTIRYLNP